MQAADVDYALDESTYMWSVRIFNTLRKALKINIRMHHDEGQVEAGDIFLFNHFARVETFIPQYLIYQHCGALCRSVAAHQFFVEGDTFSKCLTRLGAVPNSHPRLLPFLAEEILRGRKVIFFPEGGMVKDRRVLDDRGNFSIYSRRALDRRKHHAGAGVLATTLAIYKRAIQRAADNSEYARLENWAESLGMDDVEALLQSAQRPTNIVPANITFYPMRVDDNVLRKGVERFNKGISKRSSEELLVESNLLFKVTDMDIRLGDPIVPRIRWGWWERVLVNHLATRATNLDELFSLSFLKGRIDKRVCSLGLNSSIRKVRDDYMRHMYAAVTVNLSHIASSIILHLCEQGVAEVDAQVFHKTLYLAVKLLQREPRIFLHRGLRNPDSYAGVLDGNCQGFNQFIDSAMRTGLVKLERGRYLFEEKLRGAQTFDEIRLENPIAVYANEVAPLLEMRRSVEEAIRGQSNTADNELARLMFDDERLSFEWDRNYYLKPRYAEINAQETATESGAPFLHVPKKQGAIGVVLTHGFLASPAETRAFGEKLADLGYVVVGVRLKGHGASPWDLRERSWEDWLRSVQCGYRILERLTKRICLVGFSTGGALSLIHAATKPLALAGVVSVSAPIKVRNRNLVFVPLVYGANKVVRWVSSYEGVLPFRRNESEHPHINYRNVPIRGLHEFRRVTERLKDCLPDVKCPVLIVQSTHDHIVNPDSAKQIQTTLGSETKRVAMIPSERHGILNEDLGNTHAEILNFLGELEAENSAP